MAAKMGHEKAKKKVPEKKHLCHCTSEMKPVKFAGYGQKGMFWVCQGDPSHQERTGN